jgi:putative heme-binding domain-containing protein
LVESSDPSAQKPLIDLLSHPRAKTRLQALCTLDGLGATTPQIFLKAFADVHPTVREHAIRLSETVSKRLAQEASARETFTALLNLVEDPEPRVRQQLAFTLGEWEDPRAAQALVKLASDSRLQIAIMSSAPRHVRPMLAAVLANSTASAASGKLIEELIGLAIALGDNTTFTKALADISQPRDGKYLPWQFAAMAGFLDALERQKISLQKFQDAGKADSPNVKLEGVFVAARSLASNPSAPETERLNAVRLLGRGFTERDKDLERLGDLLRPETASALQEAALAALQRSRGPRVAEIALAGWRGYGPALRIEVLNLLLSRPEWARALLAGIEGQTISIAGIGTAHQQKLITHTDSAIRRRAEKLFSATRRDRQALLKEYRGVEKLTADPAKGLALFRQNCSPCHRFKEEGHEIGADLNTMAGKPIQTLLTAILDPNQAVEARYVNYAAVTRSDREISGVITAETATSITIRSPGGNEEVILRNDLKELTSSGLSLMPEGFEKALSPQQMADLIAYISAR